jgi:hypothetical protein
MIAGQKMHLPPTSAPEAATLQPLVTETPPPKLLIGSCLLVKNPLSIPFVDFVPIPISAKEQRFHSTLVDGRQLSPVFIQSFVSGGRRSQLLQLTAHRSFPAGLGEMLRPQLYPLFSGEPE